MKKVILTLACVALSLGAFAQDLGWSWGVKAGLNLADVSNTGSESKMKPSFYAGAFATYRVNSIWAIQPEVVYSRQGENYKSGDWRDCERLNYLNIPVIFRIYVLDGLSVDLGPQVGILLNSKTVVKNTDTNHSTDYDKNNVKGADFGIAMGLTYTISRQFDVSARYNLGLTDVYDHYSDTNRNGVIQLGLGFRF